MKQYNETADIFKGVLILLVVIGHVVQGGMLSNPIRYFIYSFHMPVFLFVGGYFVNMDKLAQLKGIDILKKYWNRMLLPWAIAWVVYTILIHIRHITIRTIIGNVVNPYFHLWYIPSFFIMICIAIVFRKKGVPAYWLMLIGVFTMFIQCLHNMPSICKLWPLIYFATGLYMKCNRRKVVLIKYNWGGDSITINK
jgi:fucose 4-O-acetylase-like acetyltransferase